MLQRVGERNRGAEDVAAGGDDDADDESDGDSTASIGDDIMDNPSVDGTSFGIGDLVDRDRILNNLMQRSMGMLRDMEGGGSTTSSNNTTDLKCPICSEIFVDYEASDHPNAPGKRSGSTRCSHGAMSLFTKLHQCPICFEDDIEPPNVVALACGHVVCKEDFCKLGGHVGTDRQAGCPAPKPVPGRLGDIGSSSSSSNNNNNINSIGSVTNPPLGGSQPLEELQSLLAEQRSILARLPVSGRMDANNGSPPPQDPPNPPPEGG
jgi:hypothetical protein